MVAGGMTVDEAYDQCLRDARDHYENFPVASALLPARMRPHIAAVYAFARAADDFADEGTKSADERIALLASWRERLHAAVRSPHERRPPVTGEPAHAVAIFVALGSSIERLELPLSYFDDLLDAFERDLRVVRYESWGDLLDYCRRSANPVGRLVLRIAGRADAQLDWWSDATCTALQLTNFWQDFGVDFARGRIYMPRETQRAHGACEENLRAGVAFAWCKAVEEAVALTRELFERGRPLGKALGGRLGCEIRATWLGGVRILDKIERAHFDVLSPRPTLGIRDAAWIALHLLR